MLSTKPKSVFISGSAYEYGRFGDSGKHFIRDLSKALLKNGFRIISGFGLGVGNHVVDAAVEEVYLEKGENITEHLQVFPFPTSAPNPEIRNHYRSDLITRAEIAIFIFGNKLEDIAVREADGMLEEFEIARNHGALLIPVGTSGYTAEKLWRQVMDQFDDYFPDREKYELYSRLGPASSIRTAHLITTILQIAG